MKNVLFATTALAGFAFAGAAFADGHTGVSLSGNAELGVTYRDDGTTDTTVFHNDIDVTFTLSGETDNGLSFGASIDLDESGDGDGVEFENSVFISGDFGTLSMGDIDGAYDQALANVASGGLSDEADLASGTSGLDGVAPEIARYDYSFSAFTISASLALEDQAPLNDEAGGSSSAELTDNVYGVGIAYSGDLAGFSLGVGVGYQYTETDGAVLGSGDHTAIGASAVIGFSDFSLTLVYENLDRPTGFAAAGAQDGDTYGVSLEYSFGAIGVAGAYEYSELTGGVEQDTFQGFVTYDLTGGAELVAAVGYQEDDAGGEVTTAGFGLGLSF
ncbi:MAG: porin [Pseudomonadota bacterium]